MEQATSKQQVYLCWDKHQRKPIKPLMHAPAGVRLEALHEYMYFKLEIR